MEENISKKKSWSKYLKYLKRFLLYFFGVFFALILTAIILAYVFEDKVKKLVVDELNKQLNSEITVKEIDLSLIRKFPYASLTFTDVIATDATKASVKGDLLKAEKVYLQFSIWDIFNQNYRIKKIEDLLQDQHRLPSRAIDLGALSNAAGVEHSVSRRSCDSTP